MQQSCHDKGLVVRGGNAADFARMKATLKKSKIPKASSATSHRRQLAKLLKHILAGDISLTMFQREVAEAPFPRFAYRRIIE